MMSEQVYLVLGADGRQYGPAPGAVIRIWLQDKVVTPTTWSWTAGEAEWKPLHTRPELWPNRGDEIDESAVAQLVKGPWTPLIRYEKTRRALRRGVPLYDFTKTQLAEEDLMGPWTFRLAAAAAVTLPIILLLRLFDFVWPLNPNIPANTPALVAEIIAIFPAIFSFFQPAQVPLTLTLISAICARASLHAEDSTHAMRRRARHAYLYFDGAYGVLPQFCVGLALSLILWFNLRDAWTGSIGVAVGAVAVYGAAYGLYVTAYLVAGKIFEANGYSAARYPPVNVAQPRPGPWNKYHFALAVTVPLLTILVIGAIVVVTYVVAVALAMIKVTIT